MSFRNPIVETELGKLEVCGNANEVDADDLSGFVAIYANSPDPGQDWIGKAESLLRHMRSGLSLAHGGRLQTPRMDYVSGNVLRMTYFGGSGFRHELPPQYHLNHGPYIEALARRFERQEPLSDVLWTALGWMHTDTGFDETRFLSAMTALETIIENLLPERRGTTVPKAEFKRLSSKFLQIIEGDDGLSPMARQIFVGKLLGLNKKTFGEKIIALFDHYDIPKRDFDDAAIKFLVELRNTIVHKGTLQDDVDIWPQIIMARELITRILLREIGFSGQYCCYIGGRHDREFPGVSNFVP